MESAPTLSRLDCIRKSLGDTRAWGEREERVVVSDLSYADGEPVAIRVRKRGRRYDLDDDGAAISKARALGAGAAWHGAASDIVREEGFNVNRRGVLFVPAVEGRDLARLAFGWPTVPSRFTRRCSTTPRDSWTKWRAHSKS